MRRTRVERWFGSSTLERVERYVLWSLNVLYGFIAVLCAFTGVMAIVGAVSGASDAPRRDSVLLAVYSVVVLVAAVEHARLNRPALEAFCGGPRLSRWRLAPGLVLTVAGVALALVLASGLPPLAPETMWLAFIPLCPAVCTWALVAPSLRTAVALALGMSVGLALLLAVATGADTRDGIGGLLAPLLGYAIAFCAMVLSTRMSGWLVTVTRELDQARQAAGRLAVAEERLRFSRDLHDVVGRSLSAVSLKTELAVALLDRGRTQDAGRELGAVRRLVADAQADMRGVVADYRRTDLTTEIAAARALVEAAGGRWRSTLAADDIEATPAPVREALGWAVREGVTNALRHARPAVVDLAVENLDDRWRLTLTNDGVGDPRTLDEGPGGHGLAGLRERLAPLGGTLGTRSDGDAFVLLCTLPPSAGRIEAP